MLQIHGSATSGRKKFDKHLPKLQSERLEYCHSQIDSMTPEKFIAKWKASLLKERSASQSHFNDLCVLLGVETPVEADPKGEWYCFERGASKTAGGEGWADVWRRGHFGWEYKGKRKNLEAAFAQLQQYAVALENPPLLVVSDMERIIVHTNWTNTVSEVHEITLDDLLDPYKRELLTWVFHEPERLKPAKTVDALTRDAANKFARLAITLRERGHDPQVVAHFINRLVFCMFAEDINLLPRFLFSQVVDRAFLRPDIAEALFSQLFAAMKDGGLFGVDEIEWFNGGLFDSATALPLTREELKIVGEAAGLNWSDIDPSIFGTLFERGLDPSKRSQLGAHYTDPEKIMMIVRPVVIEPLLREWGIIKAEIGKARTSEKKKKELFASFLERLKNFRVLDPACGSGNFLYLALLALKDLEHRVNLEAEAMGLARQFPSVEPEAVKGIEINPYAAELARVTVWIGEIQWMRKNGFDLSRKPILKPLQNIECRDAVLNEDGSEAVWPEADAIIGNPPFLGNKRMVEVLGEGYVTRLRALYKDRISGGVDLVCYWFEKARQQINCNSTQRAGLVATNSIRSGVNREILQGIANKGCIFEAWADEPWIVDGASVRVSLVCFGANHSVQSILNGANVQEIFSNLTAGSCDITRTKVLLENKNVCFVGVILNGDFEVAAETVRSWLLEPNNVNGRSNADVLRPTLNGDDFNGERPEKWVVDFGTSISESDSALYEKPFQYILQRVKPFRQRRKENGEYAVRAKNEREIWWRHTRPRPAMRKRLSGVARYIATPMVSSYRTFDFLDILVLPDQKLVIFAKESEVFLGILESNIHFVWTKATCSWIGAGNDMTYSNTSVFETFPFPEGLTPNLMESEYGKHPHAEDIAKAAARLKELRDAWLKPPELVKRIPEVVAGYPERLIPADQSAAAELRKRTLSNLYNQRPAWLDNAHKALDEAVAAAYGWPTDLNDEEILERLLNLNQERAAAQTTSVAAD